MLKFIAGFVLRLAALGAVFWVAGIPLTLFVLRIQEGLHEERVYLVAAIASALLVFPCLIFLSWFDTAVGTVIPLIMLSIILANLENTDPEYKLPKGSALAGKTALIVGGNRGIGLGIVKEYLKQGCSVIVTSRSDFDGSHLFNVSGSGTYLGNMKLDVGERSSIDSFVTRLRSQFPDKLDIVVLNAGVACTDGGDPTKEAVERTAQVNYVGIARLVESLLPVVPGGTFIFSGSASSRAWQGTQAQLEDLRDLLNDGDALATVEEDIFLCQQRYARSKALLNALALKLAQDESSQRFFVAFPNPTDTEMIHDLNRRLARLLQYPAFFAPGTRLFEAFSDFWANALTRSVQRVALQYVYAALPENDLERNGCAFFGNVCLANQPYELSAVPKARELAAAA